MVPAVFRFWGAQPGWEAAWPSLLVITMIAYLLGSIPFGIIVAKIMGLGNLRDIGSGNIGATNVLRTGNKTAALLTLLLDGGKGAVAVLIAREMYGNEAAQVAALGVFLGHIFPIFLLFRGGKGVATLLGVLLALNIWVGLAVCATWLAIAAIFRFSSLAALVAAASAPVWLWGFGYKTTTGLAVILAILVFLRHGKNIVRLLRRAEPKIGQK